ncbi:MAG: hypothetical protein N2B05_06130 [Gemmatimonadales bacterium]
MIQFIMLVLRRRRGSWLGRCLGGLRAMLHPGHAAAGAGQPTLGVHQEVGGSHDGLSENQAREDLHVVPGLRPEHHLARLKHSILVPHEYQIPLARDEHGLERDRHRFRQLRVEEHRREHPGLETKARVGQGHAHAVVAAGHVHRRIDETHATHEVLARVSSHFDVRLRIQLYELKILLEYVPFHPDP